jgi:hypothetical protein
MSVFINYINMILFILICCVLFIRDFTIITVTNEITFYLIIKESILISAIFAIIPCILISSNKSYIFLPFVILYFHFVICLWSTKGVGLFTWNYITISIIVVSQMIMNYMTFPFNCTSDDQIENNIINNDKINDLSQYVVNIEEIDVTEQCSICLESYIITEKVSKLNCGHMFHGSCINKWINDNTTCPLCRDDVRDSNVIN